MTSISTKRVATFGYLKTPSVSLATRGWQEYREPVRVGAHRGLPPLVDVALDEPQVVDGPPPPPVSDAAICEAARAQSSEQVLIIDIEEKSRANDQCANLKCDAYADEDGERACHCVQSTYVSTTTYGIAHLRVLEVEGCTLFAERDVQSREITAQTGTQLNDLDQARRGAVFHLQEQVAREMGALFARGPQVVRRDKYTIEVAHDSPSLFEKGRELYLGSKRLGAVEDRRVVVEKADANHATLVADHLVPSIVVGDELHKKSIDHRLTFFPTITGGRLEDNHGIGGAGITGRWSANQIPLVVEGSIAAELIPAFNTARYPLGVAAGLRWPLGPVNPIAIAEAGLSHATQENAESDGGFVGLGVGIELWLGHLCLFGDLRQRWQVAEDWSDSDDNPVTVKYPTTDYSMTVIQLGIGWRR